MFFKVSNKHNLEGLIGPLQQAAAELPAGLVRKVTQDTLDTVVRLISLEGHNEARIPTETA